MTRARVEKLVRLARTSVECWPKVASPESLVIVHIADERDAALARIAELERAAETSRAEHAAALGLATARIRELERERDELLGLLRAVIAELGHDEELSLDIAATIERVGGHGR